MEIDYGKVVKSEDAHHAHDDRRQHDLYDSPVLKQKLPYQDVIGANAAFLQKETEDKTESYPSEESLGGGATKLSPLTLDFLTASPGSSIGLHPEHQVCDYSTAYEEADDRNP